LRTGPVGRAKEITIMRTPNFYLLPDISKLMKSLTFARSVIIPPMRQIINAYKILVGKPEGKIPLRKPMLKWVDDIRMNPENFGMSV
jgi:hypothetical protein